MFLAMCTFYLYEKLFYDLKNILLVLDQNFVYKLEYLMHLNTYNENKKLSFLNTNPKIGGYDNSFFFENQSKYTIINVWSNHVMLQKLYKYRGYYSFYSNLYDYKTVLSLDVYIKDVHKILGEYVVNTNETLLMNLFIKKIICIRYYEYE